MTGIDLFGLKSPADLYELACNVYGEYVHNPTEKDFIFLCLILAHLREWIADNNWEGIEAKKYAGTQLNDAEVFFEEIYKLMEYRTVLELCNRSKHHIATHSKNKTSKVTGLYVGIARAGDSLGQEYFMIDGNDSRSYFDAVIVKYGEWFNRHAKR
jgi:hypothetical protein